jgi:hypothetical protein
MGAAAVPAAIPAKASLPQATEPAVQG